MLQQKVCINRSLTTGTKIKRSQSFRFEITCVKTAVTGGSAQKQHINVFCIPGICKSGKRVSERSAVVNEVLLIAFRHHFTPENDHQYIKHGCQRKKF